MHTDSDKAAMVYQAFVSMRAGYAVVGDGPFTTVCAAHLPGRLFKLWEV
jgi:hypothetical protein